MHSHRFPPLMLPSQKLQSALDDHRKGRLIEAERGYREVLSMEPNQPDALNLLGMLAHQVGQNAVAAEWIQRAIGVRPGAPIYRHNLGLVFAALGRTQDAITLYREALRLKPNYAQAYDSLGSALVVEGQFVAAAEAHRKALELQSDDGWFHCHLAAALMYLGQFADAEASFRRAMELEPGEARIHDLYLGSLHHHPGITLAALLAAHLEYDARHTAPLRAVWKPHATPPDPARKLRLGFISPRFATHPVTHFATLPLEHLPRDEFETVCYSDTLAEDAMTQRLKQAASRWCVTYAMTDEALAEQIRADGIDILFDLAGHTPRNRLRVFGLKPAPVQITWCDYVGTTGLGAMDYILADPRQIPPGAESGYREKVLRLPDDYICYLPPDSAPPVNPLPALTRGAVTFGNFGFVTKLNEGVISTWARILRRVPGSRLFLKALGLGDPRTAGHYLRLLAKHGIDAERVKLLGWSSPEETRTSYQEVDIALDTFPYNGGLTTCEALWMGAPVVTCPGETFASRHSLAHLTAAGLTETIARNLDQYVEIAVGLASDLPRLAEWRARLRPLVADSPLCDGPRFATALGGLLRDVWSARRRG